MKTNWITISAIAILIMHMISCHHEDAASGGDQHNVTYTEDVGYAETADMIEEEKVPLNNKSVELDEQQNQNFNTEEYAHIPENDFLSPGVNPLSTFSIDVDNASYTNARRMIENGNKPPVDAIRSEEFINYFDYDYPVPTKDETFSIYTEVGDCPWNENNRLLHIGLKGYTVPIEELPPSNLVFLIDVSGSMDSPNKLDLLKKSYKQMVDRLNSKDRVSIVTYAGSERVVLESTSCKYKDKIKAAIENLQSGGSTNGEGGIEMAYDIALQNYLDDGNNRVILATDGDFNIGRSSDGELTRLIESKRDKGVFLTILGFGMGNYKDSKMESLADHGNGNYFYIDDMRESNRVLVNNLAGTLLTIAKDVKIQVEFNPAFVNEYRLIGYENRLMNAEDFDDDKKDAGELGAGHTVTAIYEIVPGKADKTDLKYQEREQKTSDELASIKLRYKKPDAIKSKLLNVVVTDDQRNWEQNSKDFKFSVAVAGFSLILRESKYINDFNYDDVLTIGRSVASLEEMDKVNFLSLVEEAKLLSDES